MKVIKSITISNNCFTNNIAIKSIDCGNAKWVNNSMDNAFQGCSSLISISNINNLISSMNNTFEYCSSLTGNIKLVSENISSANDCFTSTSLMKNILIPYNSTTYNTLTTLGYDENGSKDGVYLFDMNGEYYTLTINTTPSSASVVFSIDGHNLNSNTTIVRKGVSVRYTVSKEGYLTVRGSKIINDNISLDITLKEQKYKFGDRIGDGDGVATIVDNFTDINGKSYAFAVLDAKYMCKQFWSSEYIDTVLTNYETHTDAMNYTESATYNTDTILNTYDNNKYLAFSHCNNALSIEIDGKIYRPKLPNAYELQLIYDNKEDLYHLDPTRAQYTIYNLSEWSFDESLSAWSSNEYGSSNARYIMSRGLGSYYDKTRAMGVIPILEIEN